MSRMNASCHMWKSHVMRMNGPCHTWMHHVTRNEWVMSHLQNIRLIWWAVGLFWFEAHYRSVWRSHVTDEWMLSQAHYTSLSKSCIQYLRQKKKRAKDKYVQMCELEEKKMNTFRPCATAFFVRGEKPGEGMYLWMRRVTWMRSCHK